MAVAVDIDIAATRAAAAAGARGGALAPPGGGGVCVPRAYTLYVFSASGAVLAALDAAGAGFVAREDGTPLLKLAADGSGSAPGGARWGPGGAGGGGAVAVEPAAGVRVEVDAAARGVAVSFECAGVARRFVWGHNAV